MSLVALGCSGGAGDDLASNTADDVGDREDATGPSGTMPAAVPGPRGAEPESTDDPDAADHGECGNGVQEVGEACDGESYCTPGCASLRALDEDEDGISDWDEGVVDGVDTDDDGIADFEDEDADDDGLPDAMEAGDEDLATPPVDTDGDGAADFRDEDADGDGMVDALEVGGDMNEPVDSDGDFTPDYLDNDADNDGANDAKERALGLDPTDPDSDDDDIADGVEGYLDSDGDLLVDALDPDSDGDGHSDLVESGVESWQSYPVDTDRDGTPDYLDRDSDQDGLPDTLEEDCGLITSRTVADADRDGYSDLAEQQTGADLCDPGKGLKQVGVDFYFVLPFQGEEQEDELEFVPTVKQADVFFNVDTTGSMGDEIAELRAGLSGVVSSTRQRVASAGFGLAIFQDVPYGGYGSGGDGDVPFELLRGVTTDESLVAASLSHLGTRYGGDGPESGFEALYQVATGAGVSWTGGGSIPAYAQGGTVGGARFRPGSLPIVVHATDAVSHDGHAGTHESADALSALKDVGARVITIQSSEGYGDPTPQLRRISSETGAVVPNCAFPGSSCQGGTIPEGDSCVLRFTVDSKGRGLDDRAVDGIDAIIKYTEFDVYAAPADDGDPGTLDTTQFLGRIRAKTPDHRFPPPQEPERSCNPSPSPADVGGTGYHDGYRGFAVGSSDASRPGARLYFDVLAKNSTVEEQDEPQLFDAYIDIVDDRTGAVLDQQRVVIIVPAKSSGALSD